MKSELGAPQTIQIFLSGIIGLCLLSACGHSKETVKETTQTIHIELEPLELVFPEYEAMDVPYSRWQAGRDMQLLAANGYSDSSNRMVWREASRNKTFLLRIAAYNLLVDQVEESERELYERALQDDDRTVQAYGAYALVCLGDSALLDRIRAVAAIDDGVSLEVYAAAGLLGRLGEAEGFDVIKSGMKSTDEVHQLMAIDQAFRFFALWEELNLSRFYGKALSHPNKRVRLIARMQLEELDTEEARSLLEK